MGVCVYMYVCLGVHECVFVCVCVCVWEHMKECVLVCVCVILLRVMVMSCSRHFQPFHKLLPLGECNMEKEGECEVVWAQTLTNLPNATKNEREPPWLAK